MTVLKLDIINIFLVCFASSLPTNTDPTTTTLAPGICPEGWIEAIEGCFLFHSTGVASNTSLSLYSYLALPYSHRADLETGSGGV